ncbi:MAG TPA: hypothetical protein VJ398_06720 [Acidimicrobiia bacterium]|nr:hypothetical protein [Acidimicrobiia bacterium]
MTMLLVVQGRTTEFDVLVTDLDGQPMDITAVDLQFMAKRALTDADTAAVIDLSTPTGITKDPDQTNNTGKARIRVPMAATDSLLPTGRNTRLLWECLANSGTEEWAVDLGVLLVVPEVIQA